MEVDGGYGPAVRHERMRQQTNTRLVAAASFLFLMLAVVPGMAYTGTWSGPEGDINVIVAEEPTGSHHDHAGGQPHGSGEQQCRVGPSKCTSHHSFVSTTWIGDGAWTIVPPSQAQQIFAPEPGPGTQPPVYRLKPPPREI